ncbi:phage GP46 family protein [Methylolobus aquaticus]
MSHSLQLRFGDQSTAMTGWAQCDLAFAGHDIESAVIASLFSWRRARPDDNASDTYGWWAEDFGSRLYLLQRTKMLPGLAAVARGYIEEALQWLVDRAVVSSIAVHVELHSETGHLYAQVGLARDESSALTLQFQNLFDYLR